MNGDYDLEIVHDDDRDAWVVRQFGGDPLKTFAVEPTLAEIEPIAIALAKVFAEHINGGGACELYWRDAETGEIRERNTYPRAEDPPESKG